MEPDVKEQIDKIKGKLQGRKQDPRSDEDPGPEKDSPTAYRQSAMEMICEEIRSCDRRRANLQILLAVLKAGMDRYGDGAQQAEEALWEILQSARPRGFFS